MAPAVLATEPPRSEIALSFRIPALNHGSVLPATMVHAIEPRISTMVEYAERLKQAMDDAKVSISALAKALKMSYQGVKKVLDGKSSAFNTTNNDIAARHLGVSPSWLATGRGPKRPHDSSAVVVAEQPAPYNLQIKDPRALSLAQRFDALASDQHRQLVYAQTSGLLDVFEAEQREVERQARKSKQVAAPAKRAGKRPADLAR